MAQKRRATGQFGKRIGRPKKARSKSSKKSLIAKSRPRLGGKFLPKSKSDQARALKAAERHYLEKLNSVRRLLKGKPKKGRR